MDKKLKKVFTSIKTRAEGVGGSSRNGNASFNGVHAGDGSSEGTLLQAIVPPLSVALPSDHSHHPANSNPSARRAVQTTRTPYATPLSASTPHTRTNPRQQGEEFLHLPTIVEIAESTPSAATLAATAIRKNLDLKNVSRPYIQYNSIMLMRILAQNPGPTFTRNLGDTKFPSAVKELLRQGRDPSVYQILCETLDFFTMDPDRIADEGLNVLREVWLKEKNNGARQQARNSQPPVQPLFQQPPPLMPVPPLPPRINTLPSAEELAARVSEANTSASLLQQLVQSTPPAEIPAHELIKEFTDRCKLAIKSMQMYISADDPPPDADTLTTLIETNDVLSIALEAHRQAVAAVLEGREAPTSYDARVVDVGDPHIPAPMHGAALNTESNRGDTSPVSPMTPSKQNEANSNVFRF
ncbi:hypothetical protein BDD12DRAFT_894368 [Trichophaea hybrida]|nr:hypothetical protein BDD12DRAFT_894368 [Trichophaea hybrida]